MFRGIMFHLFEVMREGEGVGAGAAPPAAPAAPAEPTTPTAPWGGEGVWKLGEGESAQPWYAAIPEEPARKHVEAKGFANPAELALSNYNLTRLQTGDPNVVALPPADATEDQTREFYSKLGVPESADGYDDVFKFDGIEVNDDMVGFGKDAFHKANLTPAQARTVAEEWNKFSTESTAAQVEMFQKANTQELNELETRWGADINANKEAGKRVVDALGLDTKLIERVEASIGSAAVVELLASIGRKSDEGGFLGAQVQPDPNNPATMTKEQAQARIRTLQGDKDFQAKYLDAKHPNHKDAMELMVGLFSRT